MNKFVLTAAMAVALGLSSGVVLADGHEGGEGHGKGKGKMMERVDTNGDGVISKAEFDAKHAEKFTKMDTNGDGSLSKDEMKAARQMRNENRKERREERKEKKESASE